MAESPFVFLVALWIWATTYAAETSPSQRAARWQLGATMLAGIALASATLTRATYMYWLPFAAVMFLCASRRLQGTQRKAAMRIALLHLMASALVGTYIARQTVVFGQPTVATGSGAALYFGSNPMLSGYEPPYFGLTYDVVSVTNGSTHLSIEGDRRLMATAKAILRQTPTPVLMRMYVQKLGAPVVLQPRPSRSPLDQRSGMAHRIGLACMPRCMGTAASPCGMDGNRAPRPTNALCTSQCSTTLATALGHWIILLALLAALGFAHLWKLPHRNRALACVTIAVAAGIALGAYHQRASAPLMPDLHRVTPQLIQRALPDTLQVTGWDTDPFTGKAQLLSGEAALAWTPLPFELNGLTILRLRLPYFEGMCQQLRITHTLHDGTARSTNVNLEGFRQGQDISWGMDTLAIPHSTGQLKLAFQCTPGTYMQLGEMALYDSSLGRIYRPE